MKQIKLEDTFLYRVYKGGIPRTYDTIRKNKKYARAILTRDDHKCVYCQCDLTVKNFTLDHLLPQSKGQHVGSILHAEINLITACGDCNSRRGNLAWARFIRRFSIEEQDRIISHINKIINQTL